MSIDWLKRFTVRCFPLLETETECRSILWFGFLRDDGVKKTTLRGIKLEGRSIGNTCIYTHHICTYITYVQHHICTYTSHICTNTIITKQYTLYIQCEYLCKGEVLNYGYNTTSVNINFRLGYFHIKIWQAKSTPLLPPSTPWRIWKQANRQIKFDY